MNSKLKKKWIKALRSGDFKQTQEYYEKDGAYCCLGVLACVASGRKIRQEACSNWWGKNEDMVTSFKDDDRLIHMNDGGKSFKVIAKWIEKHL